MKQHFNSETQTWFFSYLLWFQVYLNPYTRIQHIRILTLLLIKSTCEVGAQSLRRKALAASDAVTIDLVQYNVCMIASSRRFPAAPPSSKPHNPEP